MTSRFDTSVGQRLAAGFGIVIALMVLLGVVAVVAASRVKSVHSQQDEVIAPRRAAADALEVAVLETAVAARNYVLTRAAIERASFDRALASATRRREILTALPGDADERDLARDLAGLLVDYQAKVEAFVRLAVSGVPESAWHTAEREAATAREAALETIRRYGGLQRRKTEDSRAAVAAATNALVSSIGAVAALILVSGIVSVWLVARSVREPARRIVRAANALRGGDFEPALQLQPGEARPTQGDHGYRDELREAAAVFGRMALTLREREGRLTAQARLGAVLAANLSPVEVAADALREVTAHVGADIGAIYVVGAEYEQSDLLQPLATFALDRRLPPIRVGDGVAGQAVADQRTYVVQNIPPDTPYAVDVGVAALRLRSLVAVPMAVGKRTLGVLVVGGVRDLTPEAVGFLEESSSRVAVSIDNALGHVRIEALAASLQEQNERLQAQNEELQTQGEELQAQSEELQAQSEELQAQNEELRVQQAHLEDRNTRLAEAEVLRDRFFAVLGHELRNPLSAVATAVKILSRGATAEVESAVRTIIERQIWRLSHLLDDLLDTARLSSGKIVLGSRPLDLGEAVSLAAETLSTVSPRGAGSIHLDVRPVWVNADEARIEQIVTNLVGNALKYTPEGTVTVSVVQEGDTAVLRVVDTGIGIRAEFLPKVFDPFAQDERDRSGGLGLGLTLVKQLVELHGGTVEISSRGRGQGTTAEVRLPVCPAPSVVAVVENENRAAGDKCTALIVEDNDDARTMLSVFLGVEGHLVYEASDGPSGVAAATAHQPDVAFIDLDLPGFDGYEVASRLRRSGLHRLRLIAISGYGRPEDRQRSSAAGFDDHLVKPLDLDRVKAILRDLGR